MTSTTRTYVRHAGDHDSDTLAESEARAAEQRAALAARQAANPELTAAVAAMMDRRHRR